MMINARRPNAAIPLHGRFQPQCSATLGRLTQTKNRGFGMATRYEFPKGKAGETFRNMVLKRQDWQCAVKGCSQADAQSNRRPMAGKRMRWEWDFHHVVPSQLGDANQKNAAFLSFLKSENNCVAICSVCHNRVHADGRTRSGPVPPATYYPFSHGGNHGMHVVWARKVDKWWDQITYPAARRL